MKPINTISPLCLGTIIALLLILLVMVIFFENKPEEEIAINFIEPEYFTIEARVTGYNTVEEQTDSSPCYAGGIYICGRDDVVACPTWIAKETWVEIDGKMYECLDRTHPRHDGIFDISCDKDFACPFIVSGWKIIKIYK